MKMEYDLNEEERKMLWVALNNLQNQGLHSLGTQLQKFKDIDEDLKVESKEWLKDWVKQSLDEYKVINELKEKLLIGFGG